MTQTHSLARVAAHKKAFIVQGVIKFFNLARGYGIVTSDDATVGDVWMHIRCLQDIGRNSIESGVHITCNAGYQKKGYRVKSIIAVG